MTVAMRTIYHYYARAIGILNHIINEKIDGRILLFLTFAAFFLSFQLTGNEENYLQWARQYMDPSWIPGSFTMNEFAGTRIIYQLVFGALLSVMPFEAVAFGAKLLLCIAYSFAVYRLMNDFKISTIEMLFILAVVYIGDQAFFAGSWIFITVEPKGFAYIFALYAFHYLIHDDFNMFIVFGILTAYLHLLVGGWLFVYGFIYMFARRIGIKKFITYAAISAALLLPFIAYAMSGIRAPAVVDGYNIDWIYTYVRTPHHTAIAATREVFMQEHAAGVAFTLFWLIFAVAGMIVVKDETARKAGLFLAIGFGLQLIFVFVAFVDRTGMFLKYYPFRLNAFCKFILCMQAGYLLQWFLMKNPSMQVVRQSVNIILLIFIAFKLVHPITIYAPSSLSLREPIFDTTSDTCLLAHYAKKYTDPRSVFLFNNDNLTFPRLAEREEFVIFKFLPQGGVRVAEWYERLLARDLVNNDSRNIFTMLKKYRIDYYVSEKKLPHEGLALCYSNASYFLYRINAGMVNSGRH